MRVVLATESFLPYLSGVTVAVDGLGRGLRARGHDVLVLAPRPRRGEAPGEAGSPGPAPAYAWLPSYQAPVVAPPRYRMPWPIPWSAGYRRAHAFEADVVHAHSPFVTALLAARLAREAGAPLVFTHHTRFGDYGHYLGPLGPLGSLAVDAWLRRMWARSAAVIAPSADLAAEIRARSPRTRVEVIPTGVDVAALRATERVDPRPAAGWPVDAVVIASLGRLAPEKSPEVVVDGFRVALARAPQARLLVIGGGPSEWALRTRTADLDGLVSFTGQLPRPEALRRLAGADLFAFASRTETQGLVLAEALAAGLPAVAIDGPGVRDSVRDGVDGLVVAAEPAATRHERLGAALAALAGDARERARLADAAREGAERFDVGRRVEEVEALYRSLLGG